MSVMLIFYALALLLIIALAIGVLRLLRRHGPIIAATAAVLLLSGLTLLWPMPIHGGYTFLGEILYRELRYAQRQQRDDEQQQAEQLVQRAKGRATGQLSFRVIQPLSGGWSKVQTNTRQTAWHHNGSGLLWSDWLPLPASSALPTLEEARSRCRQHPPAGSWSLASEAENYQLWKAEGEQTLLAAPASSVAQLLEPSSRLEMATYHLKGSGQRRYLVRCTARGPDAPQRGYLREDIPLAEWNRFQMRQPQQGAAER